MKLIWNQASAEDIRQASAAAMQGTTEDMRTTSQLCLSRFAGQ